MKKFILKSIFLCLVSFSVLYSMNYLYINTNGYRNMIDEIYKFIDVPYNLKMVNLGTSHGLRTFDYKGNKDGFNFAMSGQDLYYDYEILKQYKDHLAKNCDIIIILSYPSFNYNMHKSSNGSAENRYYKFLNYYSIQDHSLSSLLRNKYLPVVDAKKNLKFIVKDVKYNIQQEVKFDEERMKESGINSAQNVMKIINSSTIEGYKNNKIILKDMINFCIENNFRPIFVTTPFNKYYNDNFPNELYENFLEDVNNVASKYNILYLNYSHDLRFGNDINLFLNSDHLNVAGREKFMKIFLEDLKSHN